MSTLQNPIWEEMNLARAVSSFLPLTYSSKGCCCFHGGHTTQASVGTENFPIMPEYTGFCLANKLLPPVKASLPTELNLIQLFGRVQENHRSGDLLCHLPKHDLKQGPNFCPNSTSEQPSFEKSWREVYRWALWTLVFVAPLVLYWKKPASL